jgi:hypothetical protein
VIDLEAHWWGIWLSPSITLALAVVVAMLGGPLVRRNFEPRARAGELPVRLVAEAEAVARTFQQTFLILTTLMVLCFTSRADGLTDALHTGYCVGAVALFVVSLRVSRAHRRSLRQDRVLPAFAFGLVLSLIVGVFAYAGIDYGVNEYIQLH